MIALQQAIDRIGDAITVDLHMQPFELNPTMPPQGQDVLEHLTQKYGGSAQDMQRNREAIQLRGAQLGFTFSMKNRSRIYNTFDAHRLLHWAETSGNQLALKHALFEAYFTEGLSPASHEVLIAAARKAGLDGDRAAEILASDTYAEDVKAREKFYLDQGIHSVPAIIINDEHLISGGQPVELFEKALRRIAAVP